MIFVFFQKINILNPITLKVKKMKKIAKGLVLCGLLSMSMLTMAKESSVHSANETSEVRSNSLNMTEAELRKSLYMRDLLSWEKHIKEKGGTDKQKGVLALMYLVGFENGYLPNTDMRLSSKNIENLAMASALKGQVSSMHAIALFNLMDSNVVEALTWMRLVHDNLVEDEEKKSIQKVIDSLKEKLSKEDMVVSNTKYEEIQKLMEIEKEKK